MKKEKNKLGFTLIELMVALVLFVTVSIAGFNFLKESMNSTLRQRTQQAVNENVRNLVKMIVSDLKSSTVLNYRIPYSSEGEPTRQTYSYPSSVIFPAINQYSTSGINSEGYSNSREPIMSFSSDGEFNGLDTMRNNQNRLVFYSKDLLKENMSSNVSTHVVEYKTVFESDKDDKCRVVRLDYDVRNNLTTWPAINLGTGNVAFSKIGLDIEFDHDLFRDLVVRRQTNILSLPNRGDVVLLYLSRAFDDTTGTRRFATNQYNLKVMVFQTIKDNNLDIYEKVEWGKVDGEDEEGNAVYDTTYKVTEDFIKLFEHETLDTQEETEALDKKKRQMRQNYRYAELTSSVGVFSPSSN